MNSEQEAVATWFLGDISLTREYDKGATKIPLPRAYWSVAGFGDLR